jgi:hypothetical protein
LRKVEGKPFGASIAKGTGVNQTWSRASAWIAHERTGRSNAFLLGVGLLVIVAYLVNALVVYDDLYIPAHYTELVEERGRLVAAWTLFTGGDLLREYRTYGLSRLLQFSLWNVVGAKSHVYPFFIAASQLVTSFGLLAVLRRARVPEAAALLVAVVWLISPFSVMWTFHHYSYLILPFQLLILTLFTFQRLHVIRRRYLVAAMLGLGCALTGEMQLPAVFSAFVLLLAFARDRETRRAAGLALSVFLLSLVLHRLHWSLFIRDDQLPQRFAFQLADLQSGKLAGAVMSASGSIYVSFERQIVEMLNSGMLAGLCFALVSMACFLVCVARSETFRAPFGRVEWKLAGVLFLVGALSISLYVAIAVSSGASVFVMPRRYGYVPLTLMAVAAVLAFSEVMNLLSWPDFGNRRVGYAIGFGCFAMLSAQLQIERLPAERRLDERVTSEVLKARGAPQEGQAPTKTALFFVGNESKYRDGIGDGSTIGPKTARFEQRELSESPWGIYWTAMPHVVDYLGFKYTAMTAHCAPGPVEAAGPTLRCDSKWAYPIRTTTVETKDVVVVANLGLERFDPLGEKIKVFDSYEAFVPHDFGRRIERDALAVATAFPDEFIVDLGQKRADPAQIGTVFADKSFAEPLATPGSWVRNYGLKTGGDGVYSHPDIRKDLASFQTNRNSAFSYAFEFQNAGDVEIGLDFWEQWGRKPGERLFNLDVAWNGGDWANVGMIDMAAINGDRPFSIILNKKAAASFEFRLTPVEGTKDVAVIQNIRMHRT